MFNKKDAYLYQEYLTLINPSLPKDENNTDNPQDTQEIGTLFLEYRVTLYNDIQLTNASAVNQPKNQQFMLYCTKRITISNQEKADLTLSPYSVYTDYPALLNTLINIRTTDDDSVNAQLLDYSPKTINTAVNVSGSSANSSGATTATSNSSTVGSSTAQTNSYGTSVSVGTMADVPTTSVTASYEHSTTNTQEQSKTTGSDSSKSTGSESSMSESMSIKDWGAYGFVNPINKMPYWTFGQEVPWNAIKCKTTNGIVNADNASQEQLNIPTSMLASLYDGVCVYPPSELSAFGINFVTKASWLVTINNTDSDDIVISHDINYYSASHYLLNKAITVFRDYYPTNLEVIDGQSLATTISLNIMALDPLGNSNMAAIVGFIPTKFITLPANATTATTYPTAFKIISNTNELMIQDTTTYSAGSIAGFSTSQTCITAGFSASIQALQMTMYFKITNLVEDYTLYFKHWITGSEDVMLTFVINGDTSNTITKYVDALEGEGGEKNLLAMSLRNQDYTSIEFHDYLQLGLNSIVMTIQPVNADNYANCGYQVRAISIENT